MSYDLMVFEPAAAPRERKAFMEWYGQQTEWSEGHGYNDPQVSTPRLREWFMEMIQSFPAMNGPYASDNIDNPTVSDYSIGNDVIYVGFAWSQMTPAFLATVALAKKHGLGFFDVSENGGAVVLPGEFEAFTKFTTALNQRSFS